MVERPQGRSMLKIVLVGYGQIAKSQHVPVLRKSREFELVGMVDPQMDDDIDLPCFPDLPAFFEADRDCDCVAICTPPASRYALAAAAMEKRLHVLLEKPPVSSLSALFALKQMAVHRGVTLFTGWHSRYAPCIPAITTRLKNRDIREIEICWQEDHRKWHPGARWLWKAGGGRYF
ncbi:MAG: Gfo/Idh/MocA family oxidoreductase [Acetobacteraceae bacterium]